MSDVMRRQRERLDEIRALAHLANIQIIDKRLMGQDAIVIRPSRGTNGFMRPRGQLGQG